MNAYLRIAVVAAFFLLAMPVAFVSLMVGVEINDIRDQYDLQPFKLMIGVAAIVFFTSLNSLLLAIIATKKH